MSVITIRNLTGTRLAFVSGSHGEPQRNTLRASKRHADSLSRNR